MYGGGGGGYHQNLHGLTASSTGVHTRVAAFVVVVVVVVVSELVEWCMFLLCTLCCSTLATVAPPLFEKFSVAPHSSRALNWDIHCGLR